MKTASKRLTLVLGFASVVAACGPAVLRDQHGVKYSTGGQVVYAADTTEALGSVTVTLVDPEGISVSTTTDSSGLWTLTKLVPAVYAAKFERAGYKTVDMALALDATGSNQVSNPFVSAPQVLMSETPLSAALTPFNLTLNPGETVHDGIGPFVLTYGVAADGAITITFPRRVFSGSVQLRDQNAGGGGGGCGGGPGSGCAQATLDTATRTVFTISKNQIDTLNGGGSPITSDSDPFTWARLQISNVQSFTPIHGTQEAMSADAFINVTP